MALQYWYGEISFKAYGLKMSLLIWFWWQRFRTNWVLFHHSLHTWPETHENSRYCKSFTISGWNLTWTTSVAVKSHHPLFGSPLRKMILCSILWDASAALWCFSDTKQMVVNATCAFCGCMAALRWELCKPSRVYLVQYLQLGKVIFGSLKCFHHIRMLTLYL